MDMAGLLYSQRDAWKAAQAMKGGDPDAENWYMDDFFTISKEIRKRRERKNPKEYYIPDDSLYPDPYYREPEDEDLHAGLIHIIYPQDRWISPEEVMSWAKDLASDNHDDIPTELYEAIDYLQDLGEMTVSKRNPKRRKKNPKVFTKILGEGDPETGFVICPHCREEVTVLSYEDGIGTGYVLGECRKCGRAYTPTGKEVKGTARRRRKSKKNPFLLSVNPGEVSDTVRECAATNPATISKKKVPVSELRDMDGYDEAIEKYKEFHGHAPKSARVIQIDDGSPEVKHMGLWWEMGESPERAYGVPKHSRKRKDSKWWLHEYENPVKVVADPSGRVTMDVPETSETSIRQGWMQG
jgi:hypothetical protein